MADIAPNSGALSLLGGALDNNEEPDPIALYQLQVQSPEIGGGQKLQDVYGTSSMPVFEWVKSIQTGERTYNPADSFDQQRAEEYRQLQQINPELPKIPGIGDIAKGLAAPIGGFVAEKIATAALDPLVGKGVENVLSASGKAILPNFAKGSTTALPSQIIRDANSEFFSAINSSSLTPEMNLGNNVRFIPDLANQQAAVASGQEALFNTLAADPIAIAKRLGNQNVYTNTALNKAGGYSGSGSVVSASNVKDLAGDNTYLSGVSDGLFGPQSMQTTWGPAATNAVVQFGINVLMGQDPVKAAKTAGASAIGGAIGAAVTGGSPIGAMIGSAIGGSIGGRVICNELQRQGLMTREQVLLDYRFTRDYLTPAHVNGYHYWAIHVVRQLRKGKRVTLWKHIATHRSNEIAYIYGKREKPDYLGKVYRYATEPLCWVIGKLKNKESDWSVLYKPKEI
tara:strand:+ start:3973 stop:5334 length:1362 start_codon:yes stop_codon:yes gene_type:complete